MSQPPDHYERSFDFTDFSAMQPAAQQPGQKIDQELNAARESINDTIDRLGEIQRDDGKLRASALDTTEFQGIVDAATAEAEASAAAAAESAAEAAASAAEAQVDFTAIEAELATKIGDAPSDGMPYVRKDGGWLMFEVDISGLRPLTDYDFTNVADTKLDTFGLTLEPSESATDSYDSFLTADWLQLGLDASNGGTEDGNQYASYFGNSAGYFRTRAWTSGTASTGTGIYFSPTGIVFTNWVGGAAASTMQFGRTSLTFPDASVQTTAFPGFANAALTGNPTAPTATFGDNDTSIANTAFVQAGLLGGTANARNLEVQVRNQSGSTVAAGSIVYVSGATGNLPLITLAQGNNDANSAQTIGFVKTSIANNGTGYVIVRGMLENIDTSALTEGVQLYLSPTTAGTWTTTKPSAPNHLVYVGVVIRSHPTQGTILVAVQNGYELDEIHDVAISSKANNDLLAYESSTDLWKNKTFSALGLLTSADAASTYQTQAGMTDYLSKAGNLSGLASASTARTNLGLTSLATASFSTNAEAQVGTSTTTAMTPAADQYALASPSFFRLSSMATGSNSTSGTGAGAGIISFGFRSVAPTSASGYGITSWLMLSHSRGSGPNTTTPLPWNKRCFLQFRYQPRTLGTDSNTVNRVCLGKVNGTTTGDLATRGIAIKQAANGALQLQAHNGTTLSTVTSSLTPVTTSSYDLLIVSDGAGNVTLYSNDSQIATTSGGPTTAGSVNNNTLTIESENLATITGTANSHYLTEITLSFAI